MARISYSDEEEYFGAFALWRANLNRSLLGKRGRAALLKLRKALEVLPEKRLIARAIATKDGEVCAMGAAIMQDTPAEQRKAKIRELAELDENEDTTEFAPAYFPSMVAWAVVEENDMTLDHVTPEERYTRMMKWIDDRLAGKKLLI